MSTLFLLVGLPGSGKTTLARELELARGALRLTPDDWMVPLFGDSGADGARDVLEGRLITVALQVLARGVDVVLDFGLWSRDERSALRHLGASVSSTVEVVHLRINRSEQLARIGHRARTAAGTTFPMSEEDIDRWRADFQEPDDVEVAGGADPPAPAGWDDWAAWARRRWPSLELADDPLGR